MYPNSVTKIEEGACAADYLLPNLAITDMMKQFLKYVFEGKEAFVKSKSTGQWTPKEEMNFAANTHAMKNLHLLTMKNW